MRRLIPENFIGDLDSESRCQSMQFRPIYDPIHFVILAMVRRDHHLECGRDGTWGLSIGSTRCECECERSMLIGERNPLRCRYSLLPTILSLAGIDGIYSIYSIDGSTQCSPHICSLSGRHDGGAEEERPRGCGKAPRNRNNRIVRESSHRMVGTKPWESPAPGIGQWRDLR